LGHSYFVSRSEREGIAIEAKELPKTIEIEYQGIHYWGGWFQEGLRIEWTDGGEHHTKGGNWKIA